MALPDKAKIVLGTPIVWAGSDYVPTDGQPAKTSGLDLTFLNLGTGGVARQGDKHDLGSVNLDLEYLFRLWVEIHSPATAPTAGGTVDLWLGWSHSGTAGTANPGNLSGADAVYQGYGADTASGLEALKQLDYVGSLVVTADLDVHVADINIKTPKARYVMPVIVNNTDQVLADTDGVESCLAMYPREFQVQE